VHCNLQERANQSEMYKQKSIEFTQQEREWEGIDINLHLTLIALATIEIICLLLIPA
jgi:hypothetical protein